MPRGADFLADWFAGGRGKRRLLETLAGAEEGDRFTTTELNEAAQVHPKGGAARHLRVLVQAGLIERDGGRGSYRVITEHPALDPLRVWLDRLAELERSRPTWRAPLPRSRGGS